MRLQSGESVQESDDAPVPGRKRGPLRWLRYPYVHANERKCEASRQDADDCVRRRIKRGRLTYHKRVTAEPALPKLGANHRHWTPSGRILLRKKTAPEGRLYPQNAQKIGRNTRAFECLRLIAAGKRQVLERTKGPKFGEAFGRHPHLFKSHQGERGVLRVLPWIVRRKIDELIRIAVFQGLQQHCADHCEERRAAANAERKREHRSRGEARILAQCSERVQNVLQDGLEKYGAVHTLDLRAEPQDDGFGNRAACWSVVSRLTESSAPTLIARPLDPSQNSRWRHR